MELSHIGEIPFFHKAFLIQTADAHEGCFVVLSVGVVQRNPGMCASHLRHSLRYALLASRFERAFDLSRLGPS